MKSPFSVGNAIACEHLVQGQRNKYTLINTYGGDILVKEFPAQIPLSFYIELVPNKYGIFTLTLKLTYRKKQVVMALSDAVFEQGKIALVAIPDGVMKFEKPGILRMTITAENCPPQIAMKKEIRLAGQGDF